MVGASVVAGLSAFLVVAAPGNGRREVADGDWLRLFAVSGAVVAAMVVAARRSGPRRRAGLLAAAAGVSYAVTAALTKAAAHLLDGGVGELFASWEVYMLIAVGLLGMLMAQSAFQAGALDASLPALTVTDPIVSIVIGAALLGEGVRSGPLATPAEFAALGLVAFGVFALSRAEAVAAMLDEPPGPT